VAPGSSTAGDWATDTFGDPMDFSNAEDFDTSPGAYVLNGSASISGGWLRISSGLNSLVRFAFAWPGVLPWGRDTQLHPIDGSTYTRLSYAYCADQSSSGGFFFTQASGAAGLIPRGFPAGCHTDTIDLTDLSQYFPDPAYRNRWGGPMTSLVLARSQGPATVQMDFDWVRIHRADVPAAPPATPQPRLLAPSAQGEGDWAGEVLANRWDFDDPADVAGTENVAGSVSGGGFFGTNAGKFVNDPAVVLQQGGVPIDGSVWHRLTMVLCHAGSFSLADAPGGGMVSRIQWIAAGHGAWGESQDIIALPGCHDVTLDLRTDPSEAVHDEATADRSGWDNQLLGALRIDPNEDPGARQWTLYDVRLARDAITSSTYPIRFQDAAWQQGTTADIWVSTTKGGRGGTLLRAGVPVAQGTNTFTFDGRSSTGARLPRGPYWVNVQLRSPSGATQNITAEAPLYWDDPTPTPSGLQPVGPVRVADSRSGVGLPSGRVGPGRRVDVQVAGRPGVPSHGVVAAVLNLTATDAAGPGFVGAHASFTPWKGTSSLNFQPGEVATAAGVVVPVGPDGRVSLEVGANAAHLVVDVTGVFVSGGAGLRAVDPARILDSRRGVGIGGPLGDGPARLQVAGVGPVPANATAVTINLAADGGTGPGWVAAYPSGQAWPGTSSLNYNAGQAISNLVTVALGQGGGIDLLRGPGGLVHVIGDVVGWWGPGGARFTPIAPERIVDTRPLGAPLATGQDRAVPVNVVPAGAVAVAGTVTVDGASDPGWVSLRPGGTPWGGTSSANFESFFPRANGFITRLGTGGLTAVGSAASQHLIVDVTGYWLPA